MNNLQEEKHGKRGHSSLSLFKSNLQIYKWNQKLTSKGKCPR
jgi:hypothetical protein